MAKIIDVVHNIDSRNILSVLPQDAIVQTTITSPPYYDMKDYGVDDQIGFGQTYEKYLNDLQSVFKQILQRTKDDGTLWIIIDTFKRNGSIVPLPFDLANKLKEIGWHFQDIIIWEKDKTVPWSSSGFVQKKIEYILFFSKNEKYKYNKDVIRVYDSQQLKRWWVKYPERYNPKGKALDQVWKYPIPVQGSWGNKYVRHFCPLPKEMVATMILLSTNENDVVLDPFSGSGAVIAQASYMRRRYVGVELNPKYIAQSQEYLAKTQNEGKREYEKFIERKGQNEFEETIWNLRALKYGRVLLKKIEEQTHANARIVVRRGEVTDQRLQVDYSIIVDRLFQDVCNKIIQQIITIPPLSKYGILPTFKYAELLGDVSMFNSYSLTNTSQYLSQKDDAKAKIYSKIKLNIDEKNYGD